MSTTPLGLPLASDDDPADVVTTVNSLAQAVDALLINGVPPGGALHWPTIDDCMNRLGVDPADDSQMASLQASLDGTIAMVRKARPDLDTIMEADAWLGIVILTCLDYRAANTPSGFAGYDGGFPSGDMAEKFRAQQLLRIDRFVPPRVG